MTVELLTQRVDQQRFLQNLGLLVCSIVMALLLGEGLAQILVKIPEKPKVFVHEESPNVKLIYKPSPNASGVAYGVENQINSAGFRDREYPVERPEGVKRIAFLGDSVVYGYGLKLDKTLPKQLEGVFRTNGNDVEVLNLGVSGYETEQEIEFFKEAGLKYDPDVVIVGYSLNDSNYASWELDLLDSLVDASVKDPTVGGPRRLLGAIYNHSRLFYLLDRTFRIQKKVKELRSDSVPIRRYLEKRNRANKDPSDSAYRQLEKQILEDAAELGTSKISLEYLLQTIGFWADDIHSSHWNVSRQAFLELKRLSEDRLFEVVVVILPIHQEMERYPLTPLHEYLRSELEGIGFFVIDTLPFERAMHVRYGQPAISGDSLHFTELGAFLTAEHLYEELTKTEKLDLVDRRMQ